MQIDKNLLFDSITSFLSEDLGRGDITTQSTVLEATRGRGKFLAKQEMIVAGLEVAETVFTCLDAELQLEAFVYEGERVKANTEIARLDGPATTLLMGERLALNLMQRMSGIATLTSQYVAATEGTSARIVDTRKTMPGLRMIDKYAVLIGGGYNHRFGLDDGILIKDNHILLAGGIETAIKRARERAGHLHKIEVEVASFEQLNEAINFGADIIMLDNMKPSQVKEAVEIVRKSERGKYILLEASGGITLENVAEYAKAGVDLISIGAITHSAPAVDISFKIGLGY
ncbi:MAG: carboxylating nicotinate-nucleotide diphosphorylase [Blastocatellia bacterium]|nr:carboxylating nicotinate-nucleotide diphosphorylase [Blastocatellia bacterium]MBL8194394.1 carboxylating nicotinate-nucleotide diphosphorylase [Blastocatellia bacterium]MBN8725623.1 carboxylating nicotinate-nucleotide diphosphorylase [Acidobacteriota bacterium]